MKQTKVISGNFGKINPESIEEYIESGGYTALKKAISMSPEAIISEVIDAGLRGRGGAGFPTGLKWKYTAAAAGDEKYVICNADEGEPGTFKDKPIMEQNPHLYLEGMIIAAKSIGASKGYIYIRGEYALSIERTRKAIKAAYNRNFLGKNILGSDFYFDIEVKLGAGSYLCGEELTLIESLEGKRGYPRIKPPFPAEKGVFNKPTLVNNVETLANVPFIISISAAEFKKLGVESAPGTKLFCVSGDVEKPGTYEFETGTPLKEIVDGPAGGIKNGEKAKAFLLGGAAGTFISAGQATVNMDFDSLTAIKATLGSGAIIVLSEKRSIYRMLLSVMRFFKHESCGKCVPCRVGCQHLLNYLEELKNGGNKVDVLNRLLSESEYMARNSLCPLGQSPVLPIKSAIQHFERELLA